MITFTGSRAVGLQLRAGAGLKRVTLELGNNSAVIVERDADLATATTRCVQGGFAHSGQVCISVQRVFVHSSIVDEFTRAVAEQAQKLRHGHPLDEATQYSSLIDEKAAQRVEEWIQEAVNAGAKLICGGERHGTTIRPAVLLDVPRECRISCEEVFGPVIAIYRYSEVEQAIEAANSTVYGLQAGVFTRDLTRAFYIARKLQFGGVMINDVPAYRADHMPYGGTKESGLGREGPRFAMEEMTNLKLICWPAG